MKTDVDDLTGETTTSSGKRAIAVLPIDSDRRSKLRRVLGALVACETRGAMEQVLEHAVRHFERLAHRRGRPLAHSRRGAR